MAYIRTAYRGETRRDALLTQYLETYFGSEASWAEAVKQLRVSALLQLSGGTRGLMSCSMSERTSSYRHVYGAHDVLPAVREGCTRYYVALYDRVTTGEVRVIADATTPEEAITMAERDGINYDEAQVSIKGFDGPVMVEYGPKDEEN